MFPMPVAAPAHPSRPRTRTVLVATTDSSLRQRLNEALTGLRWLVKEAAGGAEAWIASEEGPLDAVILDPWLPDLDSRELMQDLRRRRPEVDLMMTDGTSADNGARSPYRQELLYALRRSQDGDTASWNAAPVLVEKHSSATAFSGLATPAGVLTMPQAMPSQGPSPLVNGPRRDLAAMERPLDWEADWKTDRDPGSYKDQDKNRETDRLAGAPEHGAGRVPDRAPERMIDRLPELIGSSPRMLEVSRRVRLVAPRSTPVLIEGPTGSGKELVAEALHRLSPRARKPFVAINCAAIPESLLEAELFGHTRGAFTGAVQGRTGRIEAADGGTLFLDEIGEMPLALQSKLLRFFESGELQRIGDNETVKVDVRIIAATHQPLAEHSQKGSFRADLYYRLAVFLIRTPPLSEHLEDLPQLVEHFLEKMGRQSPVKRVDAAALATLAAHLWPGNVRELEHVLERAAILAGEDPVITAREIDFGLSPVN